MSDEDPPARETFLWYLSVYVAIVPLLALDCYWMYTRSGPARWLIALQSRYLLDGKWSVKLTLMILVLVEIVAVRLVVKGYCRLRR